MMGHFSSVQDFLAMGGYGVYVWSAYGIALMVLVGQVGSFFARVSKQNKRV